MQAWAKAVIGLEFPPSFQQDGGLPKLSREGQLPLYCYWGGSLDFNFLDSLHISFFPAKSSTFCWGIHSPQGLSVLSGRHTARTAACACLRWPGTVCLAGLHLPQRRLARRAVMV